MDLGEAIYREITGRSPRTEVNTFGGAIEYLLSRAGGVASVAARLAGVPASTFRGWMRGRQPKAGRAGDVVSAAGLVERRARLPRGRERRMRRPGALSGLVLVGAYKYDGPARRRAEIGRYLDEVQDDLLDAYLEGSPEEDLAEILREAIMGAPFYRESLAGEAWDIDGLEGWS